jgi:ferredoxin
MAVRKIVKIDEEKCNGCGLCVSACAESAIQIVDGKARLVREAYCDGLGVCLGECPQGAITIEEREAEEFDPPKVREHLAQVDPVRAPSTCQLANCCSTECCSGSVDQTVESMEAVLDAEKVESVPSMLRNWPIQLRLLPVNAPYFNNADVLLAADCTPFACSNFHPQLLSGKVLAVGCPKFGDAELYTEKLAEILRQNKINSLTIARMEVPCCAGLTRIAHTAVLLSGKSIPVKESIVSVRGEVLE